MTKSIISILAATTMLTTTAYAADSMQDAADKAGKEASEMMHQTKDVVAGVSVNEIGEEGEVTVSGKVTYIDQIDNEFTLEDETGKIDVEQASELEVTVGDDVTVSGTITSDMGEKEIAASKVSITKKAEKKDKNS